MNQAEHIRQYVIDHYVTPARSKGLKSITIRAGDVHDGMGLHSRLPAVCAALGTDTFEKLARVRRISCDGPLNGASLLLTFELL